MRAILHDRFFRAWGFLVAVTLVSSVVGGPSGIGMRFSPSAVTFAVLGIAFAKVGVVMHTFMDVRDAPLALRLACLLWLAGVLATLIAVYSGLV